MRGNGPELFRLGFPLIRTRARTLGPFGGQNFPAQLAAVTATPWAL
jgi:hypothetical protein